MNNDRLKKQIRDFIGNYKINLILSLQPLTAAKGAINY